MIETKYIQGFEEEGEVFGYSANKADNRGLRIWEGYFENLLSGCYSEHFQPGGLMECYCNQNGFYEESPWKIKNLKVAINDLEGFKADNVETTIPEMKKTVLALKDELVSFIKEALENKREVLIEYN